VKTFGTVANDVADNACLGGDRDDDYCRNNDFADDGAGFDDACDCDTDVCDVASHNVDSCSGDREHRVFHSDTYYNFFVERNIPCRGFRDIYSGLCVDDIGLYPDDADEAGRIRIYLSYQCDGYCRLDRRSHPQMLYPLVSNMNDGLMIFHIRTHLFLPAVFGHNL
jgi:hypothetical protein